MTEAQFDRIIMHSPVASRLLLNPADIRLQIGRAIGILRYNIPPDLSYQEGYPLLSKDPVVQEWRARFHFTLKVYVWELER
jgi:hypothetical protein